MVLLDGSDVCKYVGYDKRRGHTPNCYSSQVDFIVEITYPKIKITIFQEQLLKLTTMYWVQYFISDTHKFMDFLKSCVQSPEDRKRNFICNVLLYTKHVYDKIKCLKYAAILLIMSKLWDLQYDLPNPTV